MVVVAVDLVVDVLVPWLLPLLHPAVRMQMLATASAAVSWRTCSSPFPAVTTNRSARVLPYSVTDWSLGVMSVSSLEVGRARVWST